MLEQPGLKMETCIQIKSYPSNTSSFFSCSFKILSSIVFSITNLTILQKHKDFRASSTRGLNALYMVIKYVGKNQDKPDRFILPYSVDSILCLPLYSWVPPWIHQENLYRPKYELIYCNKSIMSVQCAFKFPD